MPRIADTDRQRRIERVWLWVKRHPDGVTEQEIADYTEFERRTVNNYLNELRDVGKIDKEGTLWFPLDFEETRIRSLSLSPEEAYALYLGSRLLVKQHDKRNEPAETALLKLAEVLTADARVGHEIAQAAAELAKRPTRPGYQSVFTTLVRGYIYRKRVAIRYRPLGGRSFETLFDTYLMEPSAVGYATYAIGRSSLPDALRAYKIERIEEARLTRQSYTLPPDFPGLDILRHSWSIMMGDETAEIVLRFSPRVRERVLETQWHPSETKTEAPEKPGYLLWSAHVADTTDMLPWVRGWGADCEALAPLELREALMREAGRSAALYGVAGAQSPPAHMHLWAKANAAGETHALLWHLIDVGQVALALWQQALAPGLRDLISDLLDLEPEEAGRLLAFWCALHDIGKASPNFQRKYPPSIDALSVLGFSFPAVFGPNTVKHAALSTVILQELLVEMAGMEQTAAFNVTRALGGHHGTWPSAKLLGSHRPQRGDEPWRAAQTKLVEQLVGIFDPPAVTLPELTQTQENALLTLLSGLASVADWIGSMDRFFAYTGPDVPVAAYAAQAQRSAANALRQLGWAGWHPPAEPASFQELHGFEPRPAQQAVIDLLPNLDSGGLVIIEAPTGMGKTESALHLADHWAARLQQNGLYVAMPTMATSNQMYSRVAACLAARYPKETLNVHLVHSQARWQEDVRSFGLASGDEESGAAIRAQGWFLPRKRTLLAPFGVGTVDQTFLSVLQTRHFFVRLFSLSRKTVIFDEVHAYDVYMSALFHRLLAWLRAVGATVIVLSATLPSRQRQELVDAYLGAGQGTVTPEATYPAVVVATDGGVQAHPLPPGDDRQIQLNWIMGDIEALADYLNDRLRQGGCAAVVCNRVARAQEVYAALKQHKIVADDDLILFHARMPFGRRAEVEKAVLDKFGKQAANRPAKAIVVATQVIEQSLDLDFDLMASDLAPVDLVLQRAGRLHRHQRPARPEPVAAAQLALVEPAISESVPQFGGDRFIYEPYILLRSYLTLKQNTELKLPAQTSSLIESVYGTEPDALPDTTQEMAAALDRALAAMEQNTRKERFEALQRLVDPPSSDDLLSMPYLDLDEDNPETHKALQALTRLIGPSITLICLHAVEGEAWLDTDGTIGPVDLNASPDDRLTRLLVQASLSVQHYAVVKHFAAQRPPAAWEDHPLLHRYRPVIFENGLYAVPGTKYTLRLDRELGLVIQKDQAEGDLLESDI